MEEKTPTVSLVSCMHFVKRGVAKAVPEKIELTEKELEDIIKQTANDLRIAEAGDDVSGDEEDNTNGPPDPPANPNDEFDFESYDQEDTSNPVGIGTVATLPNLGDLSENVQIRTEGPDSDEEDDIIKADDNLLLVGHVESDASILEVYIFNKEEGSFYVHHDIILPWFPLCIEWLSHDPSDPQPGNLCALGGMDPVIQVWDLDIENCLEPAFKLGKKPNKKKKTKRLGHKDAVLDLSWNRNFTHVLASGSADKTVLLWDLDQGEPHTKLDYFQDKVQSLAFHPLEAQTLLSGSCDGFARVTDCRSPDAHRAWPLPPEIERLLWDTHNPFCFAVQSLAFHPLEAQTLLSGSCDGFARVTDCRSPDAHRAWPLPPEIERLLWDTHNPFCFAVSVGLTIEAQTLLSGSCDGFARVTDCRSPDAHRAWPLPPEIERLLWDTHNPFCFAMSNNEGKVAYVDCRQDEPLWTITAHEKEVTGLILSEQVPGMMVTVSTDGKMKTWDIAGPTPVQVSERTGKVGQALCMAACPEAAFSLAVGGDNKECFIEVVDLTASEGVTNRFGPRQLAATTQPSDTMET